MTATYESTINYLIMDVFFQFVPNEEFAKFQEKHDALKSNMMQAEFEFTSINERQLGPMRLDRIAAVLGAYGAQIVHTHLLEHGQRVHVEYLRLVEEGRAIRRRSARVATSFWLRSGSSSRRSD